MCSPVSTVKPESAASWTAAARPGSTPLIGLARYGDGDAMWPAQRYEAGPSGPAPRDLRVRRDQCVSRGQRPVQRELGRSVFAHLEDDALIAPATAHVDATSVKGDSGPYSWRRPV